MSTLPPGCTVRDIDASFARHDAPEECPVCHREVDSEDPDSELEVVWMRGRQHQMCSRCAAWSEDPDLRGDMERER